MFPWQYTEEAWRALSWDDKAVAAEKSDIEGPPYIHHSNYWITQVINGARRGHEIPREVLDSMCNTMQHSLVVDLLREYSSSADLRAWAVDILPETSIVEFVGRARAKAQGGKLWAKFLAGLDELGWPRGE